MNKGSNKNIVIVTHKFVTHPDDELVVYLNKHNYANVLHICHSFYETPNRRSYYVWYRQGKRYKEKQSLDYSKFPEPLVYLKELFYTYVWMMETKLVWDTYIGMDGLCVLIGNALRFMRKVEKTVYWAIDFVPKNRFNNIYKDKIYAGINKIGYRQSDEMWDLSPRMAEAREKYLGIKRSEYKKLKVVQYGMWVDRIKKYSYELCEKNTIVFMGRLLENQGAQLIVQALPDLLKKNPFITLKIIGTGPYKSTLEAVADKLKVSSHCKFLGRIEDHREVEKEIAKSCIAVAPYIKKLDTWTYYADPGKVKTYLACGVPVLLTDLPWNTKEIVDNKCGEVITEDISNIAEKVLDLINPDKNDQYRKNALTYARNFNYSTIFNQLEL